MTAAGSDGQQEREARRLWESVAAAEHRRQDEAERKAWETRAANLRDQRVREIQRLKDVVAYLEEQVDDFERRVHRDEQELRRFDEAVATQRTNMGWAS